MTQDTSKFKDQNLSRAEGFTLLETMLVLGLSVGALMLLRELLTDTMHLQAIAKDRNLLRNIEQEVRRSINDSSRFVYAEERNKVIRTCIQMDGVPCAQEGSSISLYLNDVKLTTGLFASRGEACTGSCPIKVDAFFRPLCSEGVSCDAAPAFEITYSIFFEGNLYKQGSIQKTNLVTETSEEVSLCPADADGQTTFVSHFSGGVPSCIAPDRILRTANGIKPSDCASGGEVLVAIDGNGQGICQPIVRQ